MPRKPSIRQTDITKAVKGLTAAGVGVARVEIDKANGKIVITTATDEKIELTNPLDKWIAENARPS